MLLKPIRCYHIGYAFIVLCGYESFAMTSKHLSVKRVTRKSENLTSLQQILRQQTQRLVTDSELEGMAPQQRVLLRKILDDEPTPVGGLAEPSAPYAIDGDEEGSSGNAKSWDEDRAQNQNPHGSSSMDSSDEKPEPRSLVDASAASNAERGSLQRGLGRPKAGMRAMRKRLIVEGKLSQQLALAARKRVHLSDRQWQQMLACVKQEGLFDLFVKWVLVNASLVSLGQFKELFTALVEEKDLATAGIALSKDTDEKVSKSERRAQRVTAEEKKEAKLKKLLHKSKFRLPNAYFALVLELVHAYSEKLFEELSVFISQADHGDLPEILTIAIDTHPKAPKLGIELCILLRDILETQEKDSLLALLRATLDEMYNEKMVAEENKELLEAALTSFDALLKLQNNITDTQLFDSFALIHGAKLEEDVFDRLLDRAFELEREYGAYRLSIEDSALHMLNQWALQNYVSLSEEEIGQDIQQRLSSASFHKIFGAKEPEVSKTFVTRRRNAYIAQIKAQGTIGASKLEALTGLVLDHDTFQT